MKKALSIILAVTLLSLTLVGCGGDSGSEDKKHIVFADAGWDSIKFHNAVAGLIAEEVYDYTWEEMPGSSPVTHEGVLTGEIDVHIEEWVMNIPTYFDDVKEDKLQELGLNFADTRQGFYVPRYVIEGDAERGIEAMAPDLKTVEDLQKYSHVFVDEENPDMGRVYGAIPGWDADDFMFAKYEYYNLDENYNYFRPGSDAALSTALSSAYDKGEAIVGYYWEPTWLMGKYDYVFLEEPESDESNFKDGASAIPATDTTIVASNDFYENNKEIVEFLSKYETSNKLTSEALAHIQDTGDNYKETAVWFLKEHPEFLDEWLEKEGAEIMKEVLDI